MTISLDRILADHCAPVLLGKKPGALFSISVGATALRPYAELLGENGVEILEMSRRRGRSQVMVYRPKLLEKALAGAQAQAILRPIGYPVNGTPAAMLRFLKQRMARQEFPHEIGLFLGYPPEDVTGFVANKGRDYKLCGPWKVYGDERAARMTFAQHEECRRRLVQFVENGGSVCRMCAAAEAV